MSRVQRAMYGFRSTGWCKSAKCHNAIASHHTWASSSLIRVMNDKLGVRYDSHPNCTGFLDGPSSRQVGAVVLFVTFVGLLSLPRE